MRSTSPIARRWGLPSDGRMAPLDQTVRVYPALRTGRRAEDLSGAQPADRSATAPGAATRAGARLREPARVPRGRRPARHLLDSDGAARQPDHAPVSDRAQPAGVDRARLRTADAVQIRLCRRDTQPQPSAALVVRYALQARLRLLDGGLAGATGAVLRRSRRAAGVWAGHAAALAAGARRGASAADDRVAGAGASRERARPTICARRPC